MRWQRRQILPGWPARSGPVRPDAGIRSQRRGRLIHLRCWQSGRAIPAPHGSCWAGHRASPPCASPGHRGAVTAALVPTIRPRSQFVVQQSAGLSLRNAPSRSSGGPPLPGPLLQKEGENHVLAAYIQCVLGAACPGAASTECGDASDFISAWSVAHIAAPEEGRTPMLRRGAPLTRSGWLFASTGSLSVRDLSFCRRASRC